MTIITLDDIYPGATIRFTIIKGQQYLSIRDLIMHLCRKDKNQASEIWRRMPQYEKDELKAACFNHKFPGRGQSEQPVITFPGAVKLIMLLPGENAKKHRSTMAKILVRYCAGDSLLIKEIEANAASDEPVAQMARASLAADNHNLNRKRDFEQLEYEERVAALERTRAETEKMKVETGRTKADTNTQQLELYASLCGPNFQIDERARLLFKDMVMNLLTKPQITMGEDAPIGFITISTVASEMGYKLDTPQLMKVGLAVREAYRVKYNEAPQKHEQFVNGAVRKVNTYQTRDRPLIEEILNNMFYN